MGYVPAGGVCLLTLQHTHTHTYTQTHTQWATFLLEVYACSHYNTHTYMMDYVPIGGVCLLTLQQTHTQTHTHTNTHKLTRWATLLIEECS